MSQSPLHAATPQIEAIGDHALLDLRPYRPWIEVSVTLVLLALLLTTTSARFFRDPGTFWHTVTGERLLAEGFFTTDSYSFTHAGQEWIPSQWLAELAMAGLHRLAGWEGLLWGTAISLATFFGWLAGRFVHAGCHPLLAVTLVAPIFGLCCTHFHARPHLASLVLLGLVVAQLCDVENGRMSRRRLGLFIPLVIVWTNLHGGVLAGLATIGLVFAGWGGVWLVQRSRLKSTAFAARWHVPPLTTAGSLVQLGVVGVLCLGGLFVNPYGVGLLRMWQRIMQADLPQIIAEHAPLSLTEPAGLGVLLLGLGYVLMLRGTRPAKMRIVWLLPGVFFYLALSRVRHVPLFAVVTAVCLADLLPHHRWLQKLARSSDLFVTDASVGAAQSVSWRWLLAARSLPLLLVLVPGVWPVTSVQFDRNYWSVDLVEDLRREAARSASPRILNEDLFGGFLIYHVPELPVFVDDRCELYGEEFLKTYVDAPRHQAGKIRYWRERYQLNLALTRRDVQPDGTSLDSDYTRYFRTARDWQLVRETPAAALFRLRVVSDSRAAPDP